MKIPGIPKIGMGGAKKPPALGAKRSPLPAMVVPNKNPLDAVKPSGSLQGDCDAEVGAIAQGFRERMKAEMERKDAATELGEYFVVCFANAAQAAAFLAAIQPNVPSIKLGEDDLVIDGRDLARWLKIELPDGKAVGKEQKLDRDWQKRSRGIGE